LGGLGDQMLHKYFNRFSSLFSYLFLCSFFSLNLVQAEEIIPDIQIFKFGTIGSTIPTTPLMAKAFEFQPNGAPIQANNPACSARTLENLIRNTEDVSLQAEVMQNYFTGCERELTRWRNTSNGSLLRMLNTVYNLNELPASAGIHEVKIIFPSGDEKLSEVRGILALKNSPEKRPLIIAVCGTECNTPDDIPKQLLMTLFDEGPFNVLILASTTGKDFINANKRLDMGGLSEGREVFEIAKMISQPTVDQKNLLTLNRVTSSIHILGISLGGHASLYAGLYASLNFLGKSNDAPQIKSILAYCPVVDLSSTILSLDSQNTYEAKYFRGLMWSLFSEHRDLFPGAPDTAPQDRDYRSLISSALSPLYKNRSEHHGFISPFSEVAMADPELFWQESNFSHFISLIKIPTLVFGAENDPVVDPTVNSLALREALKTNINNHIGVVSTKYGVHCATQMSYGWDVYSSLINHYFLSHSPEFNQESRFHKFAFENIKGLEKNLNLTEGEKFFGHQWSVSKKSKLAYLNINIFSPLQEVGGETPSYCSSSDPHHVVPDSCFRKISLPFPLSQIYKDVPDLSTAPQVQATTRWLNGRVFPLTKFRQESIDTLIPPNHLEWMED
jgi:predicted alpha/beta-fold hydrolase